MKDDRSKMSPFLEGFREGFTSLLRLYSPTGSDSAIDAGLDDDLDDDFDDDDLSPSPSLDLGQICNGQSVEEAWREVGQILELTIYGKLHDPEAEEPKKR